MVTWQARPNKTETQGETHEEKSAESGDHKNKIEKVQMVVEGSLKVNSLKVEKSTNLSKNPLIGAVDITENIRKYHKSTNPHKSSPIVSEEPEC